MNTSPLYRLEVAPLIVLPLGRSPFYSYTSTEAITPGSLVSISFGRRHTKGVVFDCQVLPGPKPTWIKNITSLLQKDFLTEKQCSLAEAVSEEYFTPLGRTLIHSIPKVAGTRMKEQVVTSQTLPALRPTKEETLLLKKVSIASDEKPFFLDATTLTDPKKFLILLAKKLTSKGQVLILVPEITLVLSFEKRLQEFLGEKNVVTLHSLLSPGQFYKNWEKIRAGEAKIILATRQGLFAPYKKLEAVFVTEEQDESYKQWDMSPRYHAKKVAEILAKLHSAKLLLVSPTPSIETQFLIKSKAYESLKPLVTHPPLLPSLTVVNLRFERYKKNFSPFSLELKQKVESALGNKEQVLLYINRQGMDIFSVCESCKNVFRCKNCGHPLTNTKEGYFRCLSCSYKTSLFPNCPSCGGLAFKHIGFGTEKIEREALKLFPGARIARLDGSTLRKSQETYTLFEKGLAGKIDILIGTQMILKDPPLPNLSLIAMMDADSLLFFPDFKADERLFQHLLRATEQVKRSPRASVILQTFHPESPFLQKLREHTSSTLTDKILEDRETLSFPPYARLLTLTVRTKTEKEAKDRTGAFLEELQKVSPKSFKIHTSVAPQFIKKKNLFESSVFMRVPIKEEYPEKLVAFLRKISKDCIIDVDPISFR